MCVCVCVFVCLFVWLVGWSCVHVRVFTCVRACVRACVWPKFHLFDREWDEVGEPTSQFVSPVMPLVPEIVVVWKARHLLGCSGDKARLVVAQVDGPEAGEAVQEASPVLFDDIDVALAPHVDLRGGAGVRLVEGVKQRGSLCLPARARAHAPRCGCRKDDFRSMAGKERCWKWRQAGARPPRVRSTALPNLSSKKIQTDGREMQGGERD